jgi:hypothetical protein
VKAEKWPPSPWLKSRGQIETKIISTYNPYRAIMRKISGEVEVKSVSEHGENIAPEIMPKATHMTGKMSATSRIPVSRAVWKELSGLKSAGETYDHLLAEMIEREKERRLFEDMDRIEKRGKFVAMKW